MRFSDRSRHCQPMLWIVSAVVGVLVIISPLIPLGVPGEWQWTRHALPASILEAFDRAIRPLVGAAVLFLVAAVGPRILRPHRSRFCFVRTAMALLLLCLATAFWQQSVQQAAPTPHRELKPWWIVYDRYASGYFFEAVFQIESADRLLSGYEARMREGDVLHVGTHPPGLFLMSIAALRATEQWPGLTSMLEAMRSRDTEQSFRQLEAAAALAAPLTRQQLAALQLVSLCSLLAMSLTVIPVFALTCTLSYPPADSLTDRVTESLPAECAAISRASMAGWMAACLYATIPTLAVFYPKSDVLYPLTTVTCQYFVIRSVQSSDWRQRLALAALGAGTFFAGVLMSLAHLPGLATILLFMGLHCGKRGRNSWLAGAQVVAAGAVVFLILVLAWSWLTDCRLLEVWQLNLRNHEGFYDRYPRTWWKWLLVNPLELALAVGGPMFVVTLCRCWQSCRRVALAFRSPHASAPADAAAFTVASMLTWGILWLSGKNMGEAARLWCFLTPWLAMTAAMWLAEQPPEYSTDDELTGREKRIWQLLLGLQLLTGIVTVGRVNGFSV